MATYLSTYRIGDIVDIKANAAEQKGMVSKETCQAEWNREAIFGRLTIIPSFRLTAPQVLPRKDRYRLQRLPPRSRCYLLQGRQRSIHGEACQLEGRARQALQVQAGILGQGCQQRCQEEGGQGQGR